MAMDLFLREGLAFIFSSPNKRTPLHDAAEMGEDNVVKLLLARGQNVDNRDENGKTILQIAVEKGHLSTVEEILLFCPDMEYESNRNCLYSAINNPWCDKTIAIVDALLNYGLTVGVEYAKDSKLLHTIVKEGNLEAINALLKFGADVNTLHITERGLTLLHTAAKYSQVEIAKLLLKNGANVNATDDLGKSALCYAIENRDEEITKLLLSNVSEFELTTDILHHAMKRKNLKIIEILLERAPNFDINSRDEFGRTALRNIFSCQYYFPSPAKKKTGHTKEGSSDARVKMAEIFLKRGACVNAKEKDSDETALHHAAQNDSIEFVELLLKHKANVHSLTKYHQTPLHFAVAVSNVSIAEMLIDSGANVNARDKNGMTPLHISCKRGDDEAVELLAKRGSNLDSINENGLTPLCFAIIAGRDDVASILLKLGANIEIKDKSGKTALHWAAEFLRSRTVEILLACGANINLTCVDSMTPLDYADIGPRPLSCRRPILGDDDYFFVDCSSRDYASRQKVNYKLKYHIVAIKALGLYVSEKNLAAIDLQFNHRFIHEQFQIEIAQMKSKKIGDSSVTFYDILTSGMNQLAIYAKNPSIVRAFESLKYRSEYPTYWDMITRRFKQGQKREFLLCSSLKSLTAISGYVLHYISAMELFNYLSNSDLENLIKAAPNIDFES